MPKRTGFKNPDPGAIADQRQPIEIDTDQAGSLAASAPVIDGELVSDNRKLYDLTEKASLMVASFGGKASDRVDQSEKLMAQLVSGEITVDELSSQFGELSIPETEEKKARLARVINAISVECQKLDVEAAGIELQSKKALTALGGLKAAFKVQAEAEKTQDAADDAQHQASIREANNVARSQDVDYRTETNRIDKEDKQDRIEHKTSMLDNAKQFRAATRKGSKAGLELQETKTEQKVNRINRILGKVRGGQING